MDTLLKYLEIMLVSAVLIVGIIATSTVLSGLVFHSTHSHIYLEREHWECIEYKRIDPQVALKEQDCVSYKRNY